jgi:DNA-binding transcriptional LysR family regulator
MELRHLRYFVAIAEEQSITRAAERLWVAQPGLSAQIRKLESELGVRLFDRHTRGVDLTEAGELLLGRARTALAAVEEVAATGRDLGGGTAGRVRLGMATEARWGHGPRLLQRFADARPGVELTVLEAYGGTLWRELRDRRLDAVLAPAGHGAPDLRSLEVGCEPWTVLIGPGHPLAGIGPVPAEDLEGHRIAVTGHRDGAVFDQVVTKLLGDLDVACELAPGALGPAFRAAAFGSEVVTLTTAPDPLPARAVARPLSPDQKLPFELVWRDETPSPALAAFIRVASAETPRSPAVHPLAACA